MNNNTIAVIGSTNWDICLYLSHLPKTGETVGGGRLEGNIGGKGANQAVACQRAGAHVNFVSAVGDDSTGREILNQFEAMAIDASCIETVAETPTGTACIFIAADGENCIGLAAGANARLQPDIAERYQQLINGACLLLMQLEIPLITVLHMARLAQEAGTRVVLNPAPAAELPDELFALVDVLTPNLGELAQLSGRDITSRDDVVSAARQLLQKGVGRVIVTLGADGAALIDAEHLQGQFFPAREVPVVDTTAAGDVFNGAYCAAIAGGADEYDAIQQAITAAAIAIGREGAIPSIPTEDEVRDFSCENT